MKLAAIDIGSNAARMQINSVLENDGRVTFKKLEYIRFPLQLGKDVFHGGMIGERREANLTKFLHACKLLVELHEVSACRICATSAMREARNGAEVVQRIQAALGMEIQVINGDQEAELVNKVVAQELDEKSYIHIDVGGGSTELNVYANRRKLAAKSFRIGSVRLTEEPEKSAMQWPAIEEWVDSQLAGIQGEIRAVGTGGNIAKVYELAKLHRFARQEKSGIIGRADIAATRDFVAGFSVADRIHKLRLNPDRADVIVPAAQIYLFVMQCANADLMLVPDVGLIDGMILSLYQKTAGTDGGV